MSLVKKKKGRGGEAIGGGVNSINKDKKEECHNVCTNFKQFSIAEN